MGSGTTGASAASRVADRLRGEMLRLLGGLGLLALVAFGVVLAIAPNALTSWVDEGSQSIMAATGAAAIGVWLTSVVVLMYVVFRYRRLVKAAEQLAAGTLGVS